MIGRSVAKEGTTVMRALPAAAAGWGATDVPVEVEESALERWAVPPVSMGPGPAQALYLGPRLGATLVVRAVAVVRMLPSLVGVSWGWPMLEPVAAELAVAPVAPTQ